MSGKVSAMINRSAILITILFLAATWASAAVVSDAVPENRTATPAVSAQGPSNIDTAISSLFGILKKRDAGSTNQRVEQMLQEGLELERSGKAADALVRYNAALQLDNTDARVYLAIGRIIEPTNPVMALYYYQCAFRYAVIGAADRAPEVAILREVLIDRYSQYASVVDDPTMKARLLELAKSMEPQNQGIRFYLALSYFWQRQYEKSLDEANFALLLGPPTGSIYTIMAADFAQLGRKAETESALIVALNLDEMDYQGVVNDIQRAFESDSIVSFSRLLGKKRVGELIEASSKGRIAAAAEKWRAHDLKGAIAIMTAAAASAPNNSYVEIYLGDLLTSNGDTAGAKAAYLEALRRNPNNQFALPRLGDLSYDMGDYAAAADYYMKAMDRMEGRIERIDILDRTAVALAQNKKHKDALDLLDKWLKANPNAPEYFAISMRRAGILADLGKTGDVESVYRGLIERDRTNPAGYIALYTFYKERNNDAKARAVINDGIIRVQAARDADPLDPTNYASLARLYNILGRQGEMVKALYEGGMRTAEKRNFANALMANGADTQAFDVYKNWMMIEPRNPEAILSYAWLAAKLGRDLQLAMNKVEALALEYPELDGNQIRRVRSHLYFAMKNYPKCIEDIRVFLKSDDVPEAQFFQRLWGLSAVALGQRVDALDHLKKAMQLDPESNADLMPEIQKLEGAQAPAAGR